MHPTDLDITDYVDGSPGAGDRAAIDKHLEDCGACRALVADFRLLRRAAAALEAMEPPPRTWSRIAQALRQSSVVSRQSSVDSQQSTVDSQQSTVSSRQSAVSSRQSAVSSRQPAVGWRLATVWLAAAAVLVLATAGGFWMNRTPRDGAGTVPAAEPSAQAIDAELVQAEQHYQKAISGLEHIANAENGALDPQTAATLQKNLAVVDEAITESRAALHTQPNSAPAQRSLLDSFKAKVDLLQSTVALINEMRKGDEAGAAQIVSGLRQP